MPDAYGGDAAACLSIANPEANTIGNGQVLVLDRLVRTANAYAHCQSLANGQSYAMPDAYAGDAAACLSIANPEANTIANEQVLVLRRLVRNFDSGAHCQ